MERLWELPNKALEKHAERKAATQTQPRPKVPVATLPVHTDTCWRP